MAQMINPTIKREEVKLCLIGNSGFIYDLATGLRAAGVAIASVVTQQPEALELDPIAHTLAARGLFFSMDEIAAAAHAPLLREPKPNDAAAIERILETGANTVLSCSAPVLSAGFINAFGGQTFNIHGSAKYRGRAGWSWLILNGDNADTLVLHWLEKGIDTGAALAGASFDIPENAYPIDLIEIQRSGFQKLAADFAKLLGHEKTQAPELAQARPYFPALLTDRDGVLDWSMLPLELNRMVRAFGWPYGGASATLEHADRSTRTTVRVARTVVLNDTIPTTRHPKLNGCIIGISSEGYVDVVAGGGVLRIETFRDGADEIAANKICKLGMRFV